MTQVTVLTGAGRRRHWSAEERLEILREAFSPGVKVQHVARRYDVSRSLIYQWRKTAMRRVQEAFVPAVIDDAPELAVVPPHRRSRKRRWCWDWPMAVGCAFRHRRRRHWRWPR